MGANVGAKVYAQLASCGTVCAVFVLQLGMLPMMAREFHRISLLGPVANLFAVPLTSAIVPLGFFGLGLASVAAAAAFLAAYPLSG